MKNFRTLTIFVSLLFCLQSSFAQKKLTEQRMRNGNAVTVTFENCLGVNWGNIKCGEKYTLIYLSAKNIWSMSGYHYGKDGMHQDGYNNVSSDGRHFSAWGIPATYDTKGVIYQNGIKAGYISW